MNNSQPQSAVNSRQHRLRNSPFALLPPVQFLLVAISVFTGIEAAAQCYLDPYTGQQICLRPQSIAQPDAAQGKSSVDATSHCRINVGTGVLGSGVLVARDTTTGLILTCAHLFDDASSEVVVTFPRVGKFAARLVALDRPNDLAAIAIRRPELEPLRVDENDPAGILTACGFGPSGVFRSICGPITGHPTASGATHPSTTIVGAVRPGDSGGGVLNTRGQLVGIVWGQRDGQTYATCGRPVREFLGRLDLAPKTTQPHVVLRSPQPSTPSPQLDWQATTNELENRIRALDAKKQDKGDYLQHGDLNAYLRAEDAPKLTGPLAHKDEVDSKFGALSARFESVHSVVESVRQHVEQIQTNREGFLGGVSMGKVAVGALGLSGPMAAAVILAGGLVGRRVKSRIHPTESQHSLPTLDSRPSTLDHPIAVDSPPPPQRSVRETHYVPIEKDSFSKAHQWASEHVARKYPGATEVLQAQDSLIKQFLAGS